MVAISIPLDRSWEPATVPLTFIDRGEKPNTSSHHLWPDAEGNVIYQWDGLGPWGDKEAARSRALWIFTPDGSGSGNWTQGDVSPDLDDLTRVAKASGTTCRDTAYLVGGQTAPHVDDRIRSEENIAVPGMITFNMKNGEWKNQSLANLSPPYGTYVNGGAACLELDGGERLVFTIGGLVSGEPSLSEGLSPLSMKNISFYDAKRDRWLWQRATVSETNFPVDRPDRVCVAGIQSSNGTFEM